MISVNNSNKLCEGCLLRKHIRKAFQNRRLQEPKGLRSSSYRYLCPINPSSYVLNRCGKLNLTGFQLNIQSLYAFQKQESNKELATSSLTTNRSKR